MEDPALMEQRSPEWYAARKGKLTSSMFAEAVGLVGSRKRLWRELRGLEERKVTPRMIRGTDWETLARHLYEATMDVTVQQVGFVAHPSIPWLGASPDGFVGDDGLVELKCPDKMYKAFPVQYLPQTQGQLHMTRREWCDLVAWVQPIFAQDGTVLAEAQVRRWRVYRSDAYWYELLEQLTIFWGFVAAGVEPPRFARGGKPVFATLADVRIDPPIDM